MLTRNHIVEIETNTEPWTIITSNGAPSGDTSFNRFSMAYCKRLVWSIDINNPNRIYSTNDMLMSLVIGY